MGAGTNLTEAEQNRLILGNMNIVEVVASSFRGQGVDFEDLLAIGREGLVEAARLYDEDWGEFRARAYLRVLTRIQDELKSGRHHRLGDEPELNDSLRIEKIYEYDLWSDGGNARAITELWPVTFDGSPETLAIVYDEIKDKRDKFQAAFISLSPLERKLVTLIFLRDPAMGIAVAARDIGISYKKSWLTLKRALSKMRKVILSMEVNARREAREARAA